MCSRVCEPHPPRRLTAGQREPGPGRVADGSGHLGASVLGRKPRASPGAAGLAAPAVQGSLPTGSAVALPPCSCVPPREGLPDCGRKTWGRQHPSSREAGGGPLGLGKWVGPALPFGPLPCPRLSPKEPVQRQEGVLGPKVRASPPSACLTPSVCTCPLMGQAGPSSSPAGHSLGSCHRGPARARCEEGPGERDLIPLPLFLPRNRDRLLRPTAGKQADIPHLAGFWKTRAHLPGKINEKRKTSTRPELMTSTGPVPRAPGHTSLQVTLAQGSCAGAAERDRRPRPGRAGPRPAEDARELSGSPVSNSPTRRSPSAVGGVLAPGPPRPGPGPALLSWLPRPCHPRPPKHKGEACHGKASHAAAK